MAEEPRFMFDHSCGPVLRLYAGPVPDKPDESVQSEKMLACSDATMRAGLAAIDQMMKAILDETVVPTRHLFMLPARGGLRYLGIAPNPCLPPRGWRDVDGRWLPWRKAKRLMRKREGK